MKTDPSPVKHKKTAHPVKPGNARVKWLITIFVMALLISFSRLYVGVHYASDVLAGILLALAGSYGVWRWKGHLLKQSVLGSSSCKERSERL